MSAPDYSFALVKNVTEKHKPITQADVHVSWDDTHQKSDNLGISNTPKPKDTMTATHTLQLSLPAVAIKFQLAVAVSDDEDVLSVRAVNTSTVLSS